MLKVLFLCNTLEYFYSHRIELALFLERQGYEVHIGCPLNLKKEIGLSKILHFHHIPFDRKGLNPLKELSTLLILVVKLNAIKPDLIHAISPKAVILGGIVSQLLKIKYFIALVPGLGNGYNSDGPLSTLKTFIFWTGYKLGLNRGNKKVIFQNMEDRDIFIKKNICKDFESEIVHGSGVDPYVWNLSEFNNEVPIVMFASRLLIEKGVASFAEMAISLIAKKVNARFAIVGKIDPGSHSSASPEQLTAWEKQGIEIWGHRQDMPSVLKLASIFCLPSTRREGVPKILLEAASCGKAIVTYDMPGCNIVVENNVSGILIPKGDTRKFQDAIETLLNDPDLRVKIGLAARERVIEKFTLKQIINNTYEVYKQLINGY